MDQSPDTPSDIGPDTGPDAGSDTPAAALPSLAITGDLPGLEPGGIVLTGAALETGLGLVLTLRDGDGVPTRRYRLSLAPEAIAPTLLAAPALEAETATVGAALAVAPGRWSGWPAPTLGFAWLRDGTAIAGATDPSYLPVAEDDGRALACRVTATNAGGAAVAVTASVPVCRVAPAAVGGLADVELLAGAPAATVAAAVAFAGEALTFGVNGRGAAIDSTTGVVTIATDDLLDLERITVTATNSGGSATSDFRASVRPVTPAATAAPQLSGSGRVGTPVTVAPGTWSGAPAPAIGYAWLVDGAAVPGATAASYTPLAADDRRTLACRVTATNAGGSASAVTPGLAVTRTPPAVAAALADVTGAEGAAAVVVEAARAFQGDGLVFAVTGAGATIDAATGRVSIPTGTPLAAVPVTVTATNSGGSASAGFKATITAKPASVLPFVLALPVLAGSAKIGTALTVDTGGWGGFPAPTLTRQWLRNGTAIAGATAASYSLVAADDGCAIACRVTAKNAVGSVPVVTASLAATYVAPTAKGGLLEEIFDLGSGPQTVAAAGDFTGASLRFAVTGAGATIDAATGVVTIPTDAALSATVTVTATNSGGQARSSFAVTVEGEDDTPFPLEADDILIVRSEWRPADQAVWFSPVVRFPGLADEEVAAIEWTTSTAAVVAEAQYELVSRIGTSDGHRLTMRDPARNLPGAKPRVDYSVWYANETTRRSALRFRWKRTADGKWSAPSAPVTVPEPVASEAVWMPLVARNKAQFEAGQVGGPGLQFLRDFATTPADPNLVLCPMDQNFPWVTKDFGGSFGTPNWNGLWCGRSGVSAWIDPEDARRQLLMYSASSQVIDPAYDAWSGVYLSTDGGETCARVASMPLLLGTTSIRHNMRLLAHVPGGTPATRTLYAVHNVRTSASDATVAAIQLWRSADGGATWAKLGAPLPPATYASGKNGAYGIAAAANGDLYLWTETGAWRSPAGAAVGTSWTRIAALPAGKTVHMIDAGAGGGVVWAAVEDNGLYKAADGVSFVKNAALGTYPIVTFAISPADRNYIVVTGNGVSPRYSHDGGRTWAESTTNPALGQEDTFSHTMGNADHYGLVPKVDDRDVWLTQRHQHLGISRDGGRTFEWTGKFFDGSHTRGIGFHPAQWEVFAQAQQDRALVLTETAGDWWLSDRIGGPSDPETMAGGQIVAAIDNKQHISGAGTVIHRSGRIVTMQGNSNGKRVPCIMQPKDGDPIGDILVATGAVSTLSNVARIDPNDPDTAFMGQFRVGNLGAAAMSAVSFTDITFGFVGCSGAGGTTAIYGAVKEKTDRTIRRSVDRGASWTLWATAKASFRPVDQTPVLTVCPHHPARVYAVSAEARVVRIEGVAQPVETVIFDARDYLPAGNPKYAVNSIAVDPRDEDLLYVSLFMWGCPNVFRSTDRGASWTDISGNVPSVDGFLFVHPLTSDVFFGSSHGTHVLPPPAGHRAAFALQGSVYDRARAFDAR